MEHSQQTIQQVDRALDRTMSKFTTGGEAVVFTDVHLKVSQESGELLSFNDDGEELNRAVVSQWIDNKDENFFQHVTALLRQRLQSMSERIDALSVAKPFSFILEDEDSSTSAELYLADDDTVIIGGDLMEGLNEDLDRFLKNLMED